MNDPGNSIPSGKATPGQGAEPVATFYVGGDNQVTITCPGCGHSRTVDASEYAQIGKKLRVKCRCGQKFKAAIEFRRHYRKTVKLYGHYKDLKRNQKAEINVEDISMGGLGFQTVGSDLPSPGDVLIVEFTLDDTKRSPIRKKVRVRSVKGRFVGAQFENGQYYDKQLGFYLMP
jgi:hypothetical protein